MVEQAGTDLTRLVNPRSIAIIGASDRPGSLGQRSVANVLEHSHFDGATYLVNPTKPQIAGQETYASVSAIGHDVDVAMLVVPAATTLKVLEECAEAGVKYAIVFTSGFGELGAEGKSAEAKMLEIGRSSGMRLYGPNSPGLCNLNKPLGMMFSPSFAVDQFAGPIGLATQGGGIGRCFVQAMERGVGVGLWASTGNEVDLAVADFIRYMADADDLTTIATAMEGVKDGPAFLDAALHAAEKNKPVIALKVGRSAYGAKAVASHTGSLSGTAEVTSAALRQAGVIEVDDLDELIDLAALFARRRPPASGSVAVYGFSGGGCALAADAVGSAGLELAELAAPTIEALQASLPSYAAVNNPVDATSDIITRPEIAGESLLATAEDPNVGVVLYPFPCDYAELTGAVAASTVQVQGKTDTPIVPVWMSDRQGQGFRELVDGGLVPVASINRGAKAIGRWLSWRTPSVSSSWRALGGGDPTGTPVALSEPQGKDILAAAGIAVPQAGRAGTAQEAADISARIDGPVVMKVVSADITHKSDVGGVRVGLRNPEEVSAAWDQMVEAVAGAAPDAVLDGALVEAMAPAGLDVLVGVTRDPVFGPVLTFGLGGIYVELFADVARRVLPLTDETARELVREPRCSALLDGARGGDALDIDALVQTLLAVSRIVEADPTVIELEINPLRVHTAGQGVTALDAVLVRATDDDLNRSAQ